MWSTPCANVRAISWMLQKNAHFKNYDCRFALCPVCLLFSKQLALTVVYCSTVMKVHDKKTCLCICLCISHLVVKLCYMCVWMDIYAAGIENFPISPVIWWHCLFGGFWRGSMFVMGWFQNRTKYRFSKNRISKSNINTIWHAQNLGTIMYWMYYTFLCQNPPSQEKCEILVLFLSLL